MRAPNPVRAVSQLPQQFATRQMSGQQAPQVQPMVNELVQDLAQEIYVRLVAGRSLDASYTSPVDEQLLSQLASDARAAAQAYFTSMGIQFEG